MLLLFAVIMTKYRAQSVISHGFIILYPILVVKYQIHKNNKKFHFQVIFLISILPLMGKCLQRVECGDCRNLPELSRTEKRTIPCLPQSRIGSEEPILDSPLREGAKNAAHTNKKEGPSGPSR